MPSGVTTSATGPSVSFVMPVHNQLTYTQQCLDSLRQDGVQDEEVVVIDNASSDETPKFLDSRSGLRVLSNPTNLGVSVAWNQGVDTALAGGADWIVVINNDVVIPTGFRDALVGFATRNRCEIVSPAMGEGELDYDLPAFAAEFVAKMSGSARLGVASGVCFMVQRSVFERVGLFDEKCGLAGYEDEDFFRRARGAGFHLAITGAAYLHHYGSITQKSIKAALGNTQKSRLGDREYFRRKHRLHNAKRIAEELALSVRLATWKRHERRLSGFTLRMLRTNEAWELR